MQLTIGMKVMVFDLASRDRREIAMIEASNRFDSPISFSHTGFTLNINEQKFDTDLKATIGVQRPSKLNIGQSVFRSLSEVDLQQVK